MLLGWFSPSGGGRGQSRDPLLHQDGCGLWVFNLCCDAEGGERWSILQQSNFPVHLEHRTRQAEQEAEAGSAQLLVPHTIRNVTPLLMHIQGDQESSNTHARAWHVEYTCLARRHGAPKIGFILLHIEQVVQHTGVAVMGPTVAAECSPRALWATVPHPCLPSLQ